MWPPRRSAARSASSRLTVLPSLRAPSEVLSSGWFMTSASKAPPCTRAAVRHALLTAIESPSASSPASRVRTRRRAPPSPASIDSTLPRSATRPVNISGLRAQPPRHWPDPVRRPPSPFLQAGVDQDVLAHVRVGDLERALGL